MFFLEFENLSCFIWQILQISVNELGNLSKIFLIKMWLLEQKKSLGKPKYYLFVTKELLEQTLTISTKFKVIVWNFLKFVDNFSWDLKEKVHEFPAKFIYAKYLIPLGWQFFSVFIFFAKYLNRRLAKSSYRRE